MIDVLEVLLKMYRFFPGADQFKPCWKRTLTTMVYVEESSFEIKGRRNRKMGRKYK